MWVLVEVWVHGKPMKRRRQINLVACMVWIYRIQAKQVKNWWKSTKLAWKVFFFFICEANFCIFYCCCKAATKYKSVDEVLKTDRYVRYLSFFVFFPMFWSRSILYRSSCYSATWQVLFIEIFQSWYQMISNFFEMKRMKSLSF